MNPSRTIVSFALITFLAASGFAADVITNGTFQTNANNWTLADDTGNPSAAWNAAGSANGGAVRIEATGRNTSGNAWAEQATPSITAGSTVLLSFDWAKAWTAVAAKNQDMSIVLTQPDLTQVTLWSDSTIVQTKAWTSVGPTDVSGSFNQTGVYTIRFNSFLKNGNNSGAITDTWWDEVVLDVVPPGATTTVGDGTDPGNANLCPGDAATELDAFTLDTSSGADTVTDVQVTLAAGTAAGLSLVEITNDGGGTVYGSVATPGADTVNIALGTNIAVTTTTTQYKVRVTPLTHAGMPAPPGSTYTVTGTVTAITCTNPQSYNDTGSATLTIDNSSPGSATWGVITPGNAQVVLNWTNPGDGDFSEVVILRSTAAIADAPTEGLTYVQGNTIGASEVRYTGALQTFTDLTVTNGTAYYYKIFSRDTCVNYDVGVQTGPHTPTEPTTTVGDGTDPGDASLCPGDSATELDAFTLQTNTGADTVSAVQVSLAAGTAAGLSLVEITNDGGGTVYGSVVTPGADTVNVALGTNINVSTTLTQYKVRVTPLSHAAMPAPAGSTYAVIGTVTAITCTNTKAYNDSGSATVTIDNLSTANATWGAITAGDSQVDLNWTNPGDGDFNEVVILRSTASISDTPSEGATYVQGNTIGASEVRYVGALSTFSDTTVSNGTGYWYKIFAKDNCGNYATGSETGPHTPAAGPSIVTIRGDCGAVSPGTWVAQDGTWDDDLGDSADATYVFSAANNDSLQACIGNDAAYGCRQIDNIRVWVRAGQAAGGNDTVDYGLYGGSPPASYLTGSPVTPPGAGFLDYFTDYPTPPWGGSWDWTDIDALVVQVDKARVNPGAEEVQIAEIWVEVTYQPSIVTCANTTVGNGTDPGNVSICPGDSATMLDAFTLQTDSGTDTLTSIQVTLAAGTASRLSLIEITSDDGASVYGSVPNPGADVVNLSLAPNITATTTQTQYKVRITPVNHATMPLPPGASYAVTGTVTAVTSGNSKTYNDSGSATVTIDNLSPSDATWGVITPGDSQILLNWSNPGDPDFSEVVIIRNTSSPIGDAPAEGGTYVQGNTIGTSTVRYVGSLQTFTDTTVVNGTAYYYKIFAKDTCGNYSSGAQTGPHTPTAGGVNEVFPGVPTTVVNGCNQVTISAPFTDDDNNDSTVTITRGTASGGPYGTTVCSGIGGVSPRSCIDNTALESTTYYYLVDFTDPDGINAGATDPQEVSAITPACGVDSTTIVTNTAVATACRQITVTMQFTGDDDGDGSTFVEYNDGAWKTACAIVDGGSPRQCIIPGLTASTSYDVRITYSDPDGVAGTNPETLSGITTPACVGSGEPPMVMVLAPTRNGTLGGTDRVKVQVHDDGTITEVLWDFNATTFPGGNTASQNTNYDCAGEGRCVWEFDIDVSAEANQGHFIAIRATDNDGHQTVMTHPVRVFNIGGAPGGDGHLLRRTKGSQICVDCHNLKTHSSQSTDQSYGNWAIDCLQCHTPHSTTNIYLIDETIRTPNSGTQTNVWFRNQTGKADFSYATSTVPGGGPCEVCHTRTSYYNNTGTGAAHATGNCVGCHGHDGGFAGAGGCDNCHNAPPNEGSHVAHTRLVVPTSYTDPAFNSTAGEYGFACVKCHNGAAHMTDTNDPHQVEVVGENTVPDTTAMGYARGPFGSGIGSEQGPNSEWWEWDDGTCSNTYCHGNFTGGLNASYTWSVSTSTCGDCHKATNADPPTTGSHQKHLTSTTYNFDCVLCHSDTASGGVLSDLTVHVNGNLDWNLDETDARIDITSTYSGANSGQTPTFGTFDTCGALYCHSNGNTGSLVYQTPTWGASLDCAGCHDNADPNATLLSAAHFMHTETDGYVFGCERCHTSTVSNSTTISTFANHVNGSPQVAFDTAGPDNSGGSYDGPAENCSNTYCHSDGTDVVAPFVSGPSIVWTATRTCASCHDDADPAATTLSGAHFTHTETDGYVLGCQRCHINTVSDSTTVSNKANHVNAVQDVIFDSSGVNNSGGAYNAGGETCSNTYCHSDGKDLAAPYTSGPSIVWGGNANCASCHDSASATATNLSGAHFTHTETDGYVIGCERCHINTASDSTTISSQVNHVNGAKDVVFDATGPNNSGGAYNAGGETCSNTYCHSDGKDLAAPYTSGPSIVWTAGATCASCHDNADAAATNLSTAHFMHTETDGYAFGCERCHSNTVSDSTTISTLANHVNAAQDVAFDNSGVNNSGGTYNAGGETCSNSYCHSNGTDLAAPFTSGPSIDWASTRVCFSCHGSSGDGDPDYLNGSPKENSHAKHVGTYSCQTCHNNVVDATPAIIDQGLHVNGTYNIQAGGGWSFSSAGAPTTCTSNACHGDLTWGDTGLGCRDCHLATAGPGNQDVEGYSGSTPMVDSDDWLSYGHGNTAAFGTESGNGAPDLDAGLGCLECHDTGVAHSLVANPFRLKNIGAGVTAAEKNGVCTSCHDGASAIQMSAAHLGTKHSGNDQGGTFCWDCHDPHGDYNYGATQRLAYMVQEVPIENHSGDSGWGIPITATVAGDLADTPDFRRNRDGTDTFGWGDYVVNSFEGVCQVCHDSADGVANFNKTTWNSGHNAGSLCMTCHAHEQPPTDAFKGAGACRDCHGSHIGPSGVTVERVRIIGGTAGSEGDDFIRPSRHVSDGTTTDIVTDFDCIVCHAEGDTASVAGAISTNATLHGGDGGSTTVDLRDVDWTSGDPGDPFRVQWPGSRIGGVGSVTSTDRDNMDSFCMGCHDSDTSSATAGRGGAWGISVNATDDGMLLGGPVARRNTPFNTSDNFLNAREGSGLQTWRGSNQTAPTDVRGQFNFGNAAGSAWASHHNLNQFAKRYGTRNTTAWPNAAFTTYTTKDGANLQTAGETAGFHCSDCHLNEANAHGSRNSWYMLSDSAGADAVFTNVGTTTATDICSKCHAPTTYGVSNSSTSARTTAHDQAGRCNNIAAGDVDGFAGLGWDGLADGNDQLTCLGCHGGLQPGMIHGTNATYNPWNGGNAEPMYRFMGTGGSMRWYSPTGDVNPGDAGWENTIDPGCYTIGAADTFGQCKKHGGGTGGITANRSRALDY